MRMSRLLTAAALVSLVLSPAACARHETTPAATMTEAQHDSALARSSVPGAGAVQRALDVSGKEARRAGAMDTLAH